MDDFDIKDLEKSLKLTLSMGHETVTVTTTELSVLIAAYKQATYARSRRHGESSGTGYREAPEKED